MAYTRKVLHEVRMTAEMALSAARDSEPASGNPEALAEAPANTNASDLDSGCIPLASERLPAPLADAVICMARHTRRLELSLASADADGAAEAATARAEALDRVLAEPCPPDAVPALAEVLVAALDKTRELDQIARALRESTRTELRTSSVNTRLARAYTR